MGFNYIFWGLLFLLINFDVQGYDILPDFIGYILFVIGFTQLRDYNHRFSTARIISIILLILSFLNEYVFSVTVTGVFIYILTLLGVIYKILELVLIYHLCKGISEVALSRDENQLAETAMLRWKLYFWGMIATTILFFLVFISPIFIGILLLIGAIYLIVVHCLIMGITRQASRMIQ